MTTFSHLPIHIIKTEEFEDYIGKYSNLLGPSGLSEGGPCGKLQDIQSVDLDPIYLQSDLNQSYVDIVLSGSGWVILIVFSEKKIIRIFSKKNF